MLRSRFSRLAFVLAGMAGAYTAGAFGAQQPARAPNQAAYDAALPKDVFANSRSRIPLIKREALDAEGKKEYDRHVGPNMQSLAGLQGPGGLRLHGSKEDRIGEDLGGRLKELIRLIVSREMDQAFEWTVHEPVGLREGLEPRIIDVVRNRKPLAGVPEKEAAMIQLGRELFQNHKVSSATYARALKALGEKNLIDMCVLMGDYAETAILLTVADVHLPHDRPSLLPVE
jgi:4-carboxymuconolactone decarboxylase